VPISVACACGRGFTLKDEFAGRTLSCPGCGAAVVVPHAPVRTPQADAAFERDTFLLRQKRLAINEKYFVHDEANAPILFIERPAHLLRNLGAVLAALVALVLGAVVTVALPLALVDGAGLPDWLGMTVLTLGVAATVAGAVVAGMAVAAKRHVNFYRDLSRTERLLAVLQDSKFQPITATYTVVDRAGEPLARLSKNMFTNILRRRWRCTRPDGTPICVAHEDSIILALLRRFLGPMFGLLRTNFVIVAGPDADGPVLGEFNRKFTLFDRYVLDMQADAVRSLDRRVALALGVMLDSGERR
jgi:uncharacterized protein YxjI